MTGHLLASVRASYYSALFCASVWLTTFAAHSGWLS